MIDIETRDGKTTARDADRESDRGRGSVFRCCRMSHYQEEERFHTETTTVENFPDIRRRHDATFTEKIRQ